MSAVDQCREKGLSVSAAHLRYLDPMPKNVAEVLGRFQQILIPELNLGQLRAMIRSAYLVKPVGLNKIQGKLFTIREIAAKIEELCNKGKIS